MEDFCCEYFKDAIRERAIRESEFKKTLWIDGEKHLKHDNNKVEVLYSFKVNFCPFCGKNLNEV
jgi:hypothetical protein